MKRAAALLGLALGAGALALVYLSLVAATVAQRQRLEREIAHRRLLDAEP